MHVTQSDLSISIINFRTAHLTCVCLASIRDDYAAHSDRLTLDVVVVDNASGDGSDTVIEDWIAQHAGPLPVRLVRSESNSGFSGGHNQGISATQPGNAPWHLILNSDAVVLPGFLTALEHAIAQATSQTGLISPSIVDGSGGSAASRFRYHCATSELVRAAGSGPVSRLLPNGRVAITDPQEQDWMHPDWVSFAAVLVRRQMVDAIGPMDEGYFLYFEDAEYCLRAARQGWRMSFAPDAQVQHIEGGSGDLVASKAAKRRLPPYYYASRSRFLYQAHGRWGLWLANAGWYLGRLIAHMRRVAGRSVPPSHAREALDIWINGWKPLGPRRAPGDSV